MPITGTEAATGHGQWTLRSASKWNLLLVLWLAPFRSFLKTKYVFILLLKIILPANQRIMDYTLKEHPTLPKPEGPVLVCILDGWVRHCTCNVNYIF